MTKGRRQNFFDTLRRDRGLFAVVAIFALALAMLQPAVPAAADSLVICSVHQKDGAGGKTAPARHDECPCCTLGHPCGGMAPLAKSLSTPEPAFDLLASTVTLPRADVGDHRARQGSAAPPPAIRAPPAT